MTDLPLDKSERASFYSTAVLSPHMDAPSGATPDLILEGGGMDFPPIVAGVSSSSAPPPPALAKSNSTGSFGGVSSSPSSSADENDIPATDLCVFSDASIGYREEDREGMVGTPQRELQGSPFSSRFFNPDLVTIDIHESSGQKETPADHALTPVSHVTGGGDFIQASPSFAVGSDHFDCSDIKSDGEEDQGESKGLPPSPSRFVRLRSFDSQGLEFEPRVSSFIADGDSSSHQGSSNPHLSSTAASLGQRTNASTSNLGATLNSDVTRGFQ